MTRCRQCDGHGQFLAFVTRKGGHCGMEHVPCSPCGGSGKLSAEDVTRIEEGRRRRDDRVARGLSLREEARRLGISAVQLSDLERGRRVGTGLEPSPKEAK
jgi:hypothetical protein